MQLRSGEDRGGSDEGPRLFSGIGTLHPKVSFLAEMGESSGWQGYSVCCSGVRS